MLEVSIQQLLDAGCHFGHLTRKWNPNMAPYIFMERNGIHIIDLQKTQAKLEEAAKALRQVARSGRKILFVATKKQAKDIIVDKVTPIEMPYVTERWPGGMLTNFPTIRKAVRKMSVIDSMATDGTFDNMSKREKLQISRQRAKLEKNLGSIADMTRLPAALFVIDILKEQIAVNEARRLNIPIFGIVDTNSDPELIDFPIPANDDAANSISIILDAVVAAIKAGSAERKHDKDNNEQAPKKDAQNKKSKRNTRERNRVSEDEDDSGKKSEKKPAKRVKKVEEEEK